MEPVGSSIVSATSKVIAAIIKAVKTARRNKTRCQELGRRAKEVDGVLSQYKKNTAAAVAASAATARILRRLKEALGDALKLVESCGDGGVMSRIQRIVGSDGVAAKLDEVNWRINNCLVDLQIAISASLEMKIDRQAVNNARIEKKIDHLAVAGAGGRDHRHAINNSREINAGKNNGSHNKAGWIKGGVGKNISSNNKSGGLNNGGGQQNGGKGGKRRKGKKAVGPPLPPQPQFHHHCGAGGVPFYPVHQYSMEDDPTSCSVM